MKNNIKAFIKELVSIILGILIALYINNWNENRKDRNYIEQISSSMNRELAETNLDITTNIEIQKSFIDTIDHYLNNDEISLLDITIRAKGIYMPTIKINSWKSFSNSKIELMEYDQVSAFSNIAEQKEILKMKTDRLGDFLYANTSERGKEKKEFMKILMSDVISSELAIKKGIETIIKVKE